MKLIALMKCTCINNDLRYHYNHEKLYFRVSLKQVYPVLFHAEIGSFKWHHVKNGMTFLYDASTMLVTYICESSKLQYSNPSIPGQSSKVFELWQFVRIAFRLSSYSFVLKKMFLLYILVQSVPINNYCQVNLEQMLSVGRNLHTNCTCETLQHKI
jgi:hypothetical protein